MKLLSVFFLMFIEITSSNPNCPKIRNGVINVHIICHSHDDLGWIYTADEYYDAFYVLRRVKDILSSSIDMLLRNSSRKFIHAEMAYFNMWWNEQNETFRELVKGLVKTGQLEFASGGWSQNDEATPYYYEIIDQMTLGLTFIKETFGKKAIPKVGWHVDQFGHSREQASILAQMGMNGLFIGRVDYFQFKNRQNSMEMEMIWEGSDYLGENATIFTSILPGGYSTPEGLCFDALCYKAHLLSETDLESLSKSFSAYVAATEKVYVTPNIIMTMGGDFHYSEAESNFNALDVLIEYVNEKKELGINAFYSTPSCYLEAVYKASEVWPSKSDDFFPYSTKPYFESTPPKTLDYWTAYFTSRPTLKRFVRFVSSIFRAIKQIVAITGMERDPAINNLAGELGIVHHHDGITGTAKQYVTDDYVKKLWNGLEDTNNLLNKGLNVLTNQDPPLEMKFTSCPLLNISSCPPSEGETPFVVNVYNPLARPKSHYIRIPVKSALNYIVKSSKGVFIETQIIPLPEGVSSIPGRNSEAEYDLIFYAERIPPLGVLQFLISVDETQSAFVSTDISDIIGPTISNEKFMLTLDPESNFLDSITVKRSDLTREPRIINVTQQWLRYGKRSHLTGIRSGAYLFRPTSTAVPINNNARISAIYKGPLVTEIHQVWTPWLSQVIRMYKNKDYIELEWLAGELPVENDDDIEVINRITWRDMKTDGVFYTDANGREMQKRIKKSPMNHQKESSSTPSNYYPVTSRIILRSQNNQGEAALMNDRAQGGSSLSDGEMELMVHRRLQRDDSKGVEEALDEMAFEKGLVARGKHYMIHSFFGTEECDFGCLHRTLGEELVLEPIITFSNRTTFKEREPRSSLATVFPPNLHLLTLEPWSEGTWLLRIENFLEKDESTLSGGVKLDIKNLFMDWEIQLIEEVNLSATTRKNEVNRLKWYTMPKSVDDMPLVTTWNDELPNTFYFAPMQIRTFIVEVSFKTRWKL